MSGRTVRGPKRRPNRERTEVRLDSGRGEVEGLVEAVGRDDPPKTAPTKVGTAIAKPPIKNQCTARVRKTGERCRRHAILGSNVCPKHGGSAPQVKQAARVRLAMAADDLIKMLLKIATSSADEGVRLRAVTAALDRAGFGPGATVEVSHELKPFEQLLSRIDRSGPPPAPYRPDPAALLRGATDDGDVVDAEVVEEDEDSRSCPVVRTANGKRIPATRAVIRTGPAVAPLVTHDEMWGDNTPDLSDPNSAHIARGV